MPPPSAPAAVKAGKTVKKAVLNPAAIPDYFGTIPNYANSPLPMGPIGSIVVTDGARATRAAR